MHTIIDYVLLIFFLGYEIYKKVKSSPDIFLGPKHISEVYCIYSSGVKTLKSLEYLPPNIFRYAFPDQIPYQHFGDGDGTVNLRSLQVCTHWDEVKIITFHGLDHKTTVEEKTVLELIANVTGAEITI